MFEKAGGGRHDVPRLKAIEYSEATEWDACRPSRNSVAHTNVEQERATSFVLQHLTSEPTPWSKLEGRAEAEGISNGALNLVRTHSAKEGMILQIGRGPSAKWVLNDPNKAKSK